jgi:hypothetical protein
MQQKRERRKSTPAEISEMEKQLNPAQLEAWRMLQTFGWQLRFVRRPLFQQPVAVIVNKAGQMHAVIEEDGRVNDKPGFKIR